MLSPHRTTLKDIAQATGFSINTVSRALKGSTSISQATREKICQVAAKLGYVVNASATAMRLGFTRTIAVIVGDIANPHFAIMVKEMESEARASKYGLIVLNTDEDAQREAEAVELALSKGVDGIIICPVQQSQDSIRRIAAAQVPFVLIGRHFDGLPANAVVCDDAQGGELATEHLLSLGHRKICFFNAPEYISSARERREGYCRAFEKAGLAVDPAMIHTLPMHQAQRLADMRRVLSSREITAIFAFSDVIAWEAACVLQEMGRRVPEDVSLVGFDNLLSKMSFPFSLTSVRTFKTLMSVEAVKMLLSRMTAPYDPHAPVSKQVISTSLSVRGSTGPVKKV